MKMLKKVFCLLTVLCLCLTFVGCGSGKSLEDVKSAGKLVMATSPDFPPFESLEGSEVVGIEVEILEKFAEEIGVELEIKQMDFDSVLPGVQSGKYDVGVSGIPITQDRKKNADFTEPYFMASQAIVVLKDSDIKSKADLKGKKISVQTGNAAVDDYFKGNITLINNLLMSLAEEQIKSAFAQSEKEVQDLHIRISQGMRESKNSGKQIGLTKGTTLTTEKSIKCKEIIKKHAIEFGGTLSDKEVMTLCKISRNSYYKYKRELKEGL